MRVFVLTGGIGCGKSTVARLLNCNNIAVIDTDVLARRVVEPGMPGRRAIYRAFGESVFRKGEDGQVELDRAALARAAFSDESGSRKRQLERCTHPYINRMLIWQLLRISLGMRQTEGVPPGCSPLPAPAAVCLDIPLFYEAGFSQKGPLALLPVVCVSVANSDIQIARILSRTEGGGPDITREDAERRISNQLPVPHKAELATYVIDNSGEQSALEGEVEKMLRTDLWAARRLRLGREQGAWEDEVQEKARALKARTRELAKARKEAQSDDSSAPATPEQQRALQRASELEAVVRRLGKEVAEPGPVTVSKVIVSWSLQHMFLLLWVTIVLGTVIVLLVGVLAEKLVHRHKEA